MSRFDHIPVQIHRAAASAAAVLQKQKWVWSDARICAFLFVLSAPWARVFDMRAIEDGRFHGGSFLVRFVAWRPKSSMIANPHLFHKGLMLRQALSPGQAPELLARLLYILPVQTSAYHVSFKSGITS